jgi:tetratricopeptide (TPR) repeat protein
MGFRLYRRVNLGGGVHLNISKTGVGISAGVPGARYSVHSSGRTVKTVGVPGTGVYYRKDTYAKKAGSGPRTRSRSAPAAPVVAMYPKAGLLAPKEDKAFVRGVTAYMQGKHEEALGHLQEVMRLDERQAHVGEEFFAGLSLIGLGRFAEAVAPFEAVIASHQPIPDALMTKYKVGGQLKVQITPMVEATMPMSTLSAALMLAELYQHTDKPQRAIELLESLGHLTGQPVFALSLSELYSLAERPDDVLRVSEDFTSNTDDLTAQLLVFRAGALADKGLTDAALDTLKEAMRFRSRETPILHQARYLRALILEKAGRKAQSKKDLERIYAEDPHFHDVAERLGMQAPPPRPDA